MERNDGPQAQKPNGIPDDPSSPYYLKFCYVCTEQAKVEHIKNYGAIVCFSCRAFWRRTFQKSTMPNYVCKNDQKCVLSVSNRRSCQKCRFDKCVSAGMLPEAVMTDDQKEIRFHKYLQKKKFKQKIKNKNRKRKNVKNEQGTTQETTSDREPSNPSEVLKIRIKLPKLETESSLVKSENIFRKLQPRVEEIVEKYQIHLNSATDDIINRIKSLSDHDELFDLLLKVSGSFQEFAVALRSFDRLCPKDQGMLLGRNTPIFVQLIFAHSILQCWRSASQNSVFCNEDLITLEKFLTKLKVFKTGTSLRLYIEHMWSLGSLLKLENDDRMPILAYVILFDCSDSLNIDQYEILQDIEMLNIFMVDNFVKNEVGLDAVELKNLISTLEKMAVFFAHTTNDDQLKTKCQQRSLIAANLVIPYTAEEDDWLQRQLQLVEDAIFSVPVGESIIHEFMMFSLGDPLSKGYMNSFFAIQHERVWRVFQLHPEFQDLSVASKLAMYRSNATSGISTMLVKAESCATGVEQLMLGLGKTEQADWILKYGTVFNEPHKIRRMSLSENKLMPQTSIEKYFELHDRANTFVDDPVIFKVNILLSLFHLTPIPEEDSIRKAREKYIKVLQRRLDWLLKKRNSRQRKFALWGCSGSIVKKLFENIEVQREIASTIFVKPPDGIE